MFKLLVIAALVGVACSAPAGKINPNLLQVLSSGESAKVVIRFVGSNRAVVDTIENRTFQTRADRLNTLNAALKSHTAASQKNVVAFLNSKSIPFKSYHVSNQIFLTADLKTVEALSNFDEIEELREEIIVHLETPAPRKVARRDPTPLAEWGIEIIQAEAAWAITNGTGVVVSNIDTGVRYTHEAVADQYRREYGWFDPYQGTELPNDQNGHGTHTMGTTIGTHGIGVAPGAQWIACKGCATSSCTEDALNQCGQWVLCPTMPDGSQEDCSMAPVLCSNSWGGGRGDTWYEPITEAWIGGGIIPLFSIGNSGSSCGTANSPGDLRRVIGVGSTNIADEISYFSSVGPAADGRIKPEISAPGEDVTSSIPDSDSSYGSKSGTSMACPHAAGVTALLLSVNPNLSFAQVRQALLDSCDTDLSSQNAECGGLNDGVFPNHHFGWGRINALKLVQSAKK